MCDCYKRVFSSGFSDVNHFIFIKINSNATVEYHKILKQTNQIFSAFCFQENAIISLLFKNNFHSWHLHTTIAILFYFSSSVSALNKHAYNNFPHIFPFEKKEEIVDNKTKELWQTKFFGKCLKDFFRLFLLLKGFYGEMRRKEVFEWCCNGMEGECGIVTSCFWAIVIL